jgi:hypothetical protein
VNYRPVAHRDQRGAAGGDDVEALVAAPATSRGAEFADETAGAVGALDREDMAEIGNSAVARGDSGRRRSDQNDD